MSIPKTILVPVDFSDTADLALDYGCRLAEKFGAVVHLLYVVEAAHIGPPGAALWGYSLPALVKRLEDAAEMRMAALAPDYETLVVERVAKVGEPFVEIVRYARTADIDLIVIGSHGRGAVTHVLLGSVAERVIRTAPCPVLTVRSPGRTFAMP